MPISDPVESDSELHAFISCFGLENITTTNNKCTASYKEQLYTFTDNIPANGSVLCLANGLEFDIHNKNAFSNADLAGMTCVFDDLTFGEAADIMTDRE